MDFVYLLSLVPSLAKDIIKFHLFIHSRLFCQPWHSHIFLQLPTSPVWRSVNFDEDEKRREMFGSMCTNKVRKNVFVSQFIIDQIYIKISSMLLPNLTPATPIPTRPLDLSPSILMCTWIWQCHVNLIKLNEWRRRERDEKEASSKNKHKNFSWRFQSEKIQWKSAWNKRIGRVRETETRKDEMEIN